MAFSDWSTNPANNGIVAGVTYWPEGMLPGQVNDTGRQMMADLATWLAAPSFATGTSLTVPGSLSVTGAANFTGAVSAGSLTVAGAPVNPANLAYLTGAAFSGGVSSPNITASAPTFGQISIVPGNTTVSGYALFKAASGTNLGYIGQQTASGPINYVAQNGGGHTFSGGSLNSINGLLVNGSPVWYAGNFSPSNYAALSGAVFTGGISAASLAVSGGVQAATVFIGADWSVTETSGKLTFAYQGTAKFSMDSGGNLRCAGNVVGSTTP